MPGPPSKTVIGSDGGCSAWAGRTTTWRPIRRPSAFERSSATSSVPQSTVSSIPSSVQGVSEGRRSAARAAQSGVPCSVCAATVDAAVTVSRSRRDLERRGSDQDGDPLRVVQDEPGRSNRTVHRELDGGFHDPGLQGAWRAGRQASLASGPVGGIGSGARVVRPGDDDLLAPRPGDGRPGEGRAPVGHREHFLDGARRDRSGRLLRSGDSGDGRQDQDQQEARRTQVVAGTRKVRESSRLGY